MSSSCVQMSFSVFVGCAVETFVDEVAYGCVLPDVVFHAQSSEVLAVHDDEFWLFCAMHGHYIIAVSCLGVGLVGLLDCLAIAEVVDELMDDCVVHNLMGFMG